MAKPSVNHHRAALCVCCVISRSVLVVAYFFLEHLRCNYWGLVMLIGVDVLILDVLLLVFVSFLVVLLLVGVPRSNPPFLVLPPKRNIVL